MSDCCKTGFKWEGDFIGKETTLAGNNAYVTGTNKHAVVLIIHDIYGWRFRNARVLADHYAKEADVTVYLPDYLDGEVVDQDTLDNPEKRKNFDMGAFFQRHHKAKVQTQVDKDVKALRGELGFAKIGAIGFCFGGSFPFALGKKGSASIDAAASAHPAQLTKEEIGSISVPLLMIAPEHDPTYTQELKDYSNSVVPTLGVPYAYEYFPNVAHGFATRGNPKDPHSGAALERAKNVAVTFWKEFLHDNVPAKF